MGRPSRLTAVEIERVRQVYAAWMAIRQERLRLGAELGLRHSEFTDYGRGTRGKKPRPMSATAIDRTTFDWISTTPRTPE
jgi:hypothetical protein